MSAEFAKMLKVLFFVFIVRKLWIKCKKGSNLFSGITILILKWWKDWRTLQAWTIENVLRSFFFSFEYQLKKT